MTSRPPGGLLCRMTVGREVWMEELGQELSKEWDRRARTPVWEGGVLEAFQWAGGAGMQWEAAGDSKQIWRDEQGHVTYRHGQDTDFILSRMENEWNRMVELAKEGRNRIWLTYKYPWWQEHKPSEQAAPAALPVGDGGTHVNKLVQSFWRKFIFGESLFWGKAGMKDGIENVGWSYWKVGGAMLR